MMTNFNPARDGFAFDNSFVNDFIPSLNIRTSGLCGGMSYAALDYFYEHIPIPTQNFRPPDNSPLQKFLYNREVTSIVSNADKWAELMFNPFGWRTDEFFNWGLQGFNGGRLQELRESIDANKPVPLGLFKAGNAGMGPHHQVIAIGYDLGQYKGDLKGHEEDLKIYLCDPNHPHQTVTLVPNVKNHEYYELEHPDEKWMTYFVDKKYRTINPPPNGNKAYPADGKFHELTLYFKTGGDDLRGGNDNVDVIINSWTGDQQIVRNVNKGARWIDHYGQYVTIPLNKPITRGELKSITLETTFRGGIGGDNWNLDEFQVIGQGNTSEQIADHRGSPFIRFTGSHKKEVITINSTPPSHVTTPGTPLVKTLDLEFITGGDDLRGGNDNLNVTIHYADGRTQVVENVNAGHRWGNNSTHNVMVNLLRPVAPTEIKGLTLGTTFGGGIGGDNWNLQRLAVISEESDNSHIRMYDRSGNPLKRFTGSDKTMLVNF